MSDAVVEKRSHKRVAIPRLALIANADVSCDAYVEDISLSGVQLRNADHETSFEGSFSVGTEVALEIEKMSSLSGNVVRISEPMLAIMFPERTEDEIKALAAEIMEGQVWFSFDDPEAHDLTTSD